MKKIALLLVSLSIAVSATAKHPNIKAPHPTHTVQNNILSEIKVSDEWIRDPAKGSVNSAAYFNIRNDSDIDIKIIGAKAEKGLCKHTEIHGYKPDDKGVMKMFQLESITIPAKTTLEFKPGGNHIMLMGLKEEILQKAHYTIKFQVVPANKEVKAIIPDLTIKFPVK